MKLVLLLVVASLAAVAIFTYGRETASSTRATVGRAAIATPRRALSAEEQAYIDALWPIHADVERSTMYLSLGQIFYKTGDLSRDELKGRVDEALAAYRRNETLLRSLGPPPSLQSSHGSYVAAVVLFEQSALEIERMFDDGNDDHLLAAYPLSQEGSDRIRDVGGKFWPEEFPPN